MSNFVPISIDREIEDREDNISGVLSPKVMGQLSKECADAILLLDKIGGYVSAIKMRARRGAVGYQWFKTRIVISAPSATLVPGVDSTQDLVIELDINVDDLNMPPEGFVADEITKMVLSKATSYLYALRHCTERWEELLA